MRAPLSPGMEAILADERWRAKLKAAGFRIVLETYVPTRDAVPAPAASAPIDGRNASR